jgi:hypothetical protein
MFSVSFLWRRRIPPNAQPAAAILTEDLANLLDALLGSPASYELHNKNYYGDNQKRMYETASNMERKA